MEVLAATLGMLGAVAGIVQVVVMIVERRDRRSRRRGPGLNSAPVLDPVTIPIPAPRPTPQSAPPSTPYEPLFGQQPPVNPERLAVAWRSAAAYLLGWISMLIFGKDPRPEVRFHAAQSLCIDLAAALYFFIACCALMPYTAIRYPGTDATYDSDDPMLWTWFVTAFAGAPLLHLGLAIASMLGRQVRVPLLWRLAAAMAARRVETPASPRNF